MRSSSLLPAFATSISLASAYLAGTSSKRGLAYGTFANASDDDIWNAASGDLTWYYNFDVYPTKGIDQWQMQFVPMMWGDAAGDQGFYKKVEKLIDEGWNISYILGFNEPDICSGGGSCVQAATAAQSWIKNIEPLKKHGIKLGAPAVTGGDLTWLQEFYTACDGKCSTDFIPLHFYSDFPGLQDWVGNISTIYTNMTVWVTEWACPDCELYLAQEAFNQSVVYLDNKSVVTHYAYFGSFRQDKSNTFLGPNVAMLDNDGALTDIGAWYLGVENSDVNKTHIGPAATKPSPPHQPSASGASGSGSGSGSSSSSSASTTLRPWLLGGAMAITFWTMVVFG